jgi:hypothetical protein
MTAPNPLRRTLATVTVLAAVGTAFAAGTLVADRGGEDPSYRLTAAGLDDGLSCEGLQRWYVAHGLDRVTAWGWQVPTYRTYAPSLAAEDAAGAVPAAPLDTRTGSDTGTNVQEAGVDEPDIVKATGHLLVRISAGSLDVDDVSGVEPRRLGVVPLDRMGDPELLLAGDRAVVIGAEVDHPAAGAPFTPPPPRTWVRTYDLSDPSTPTLVDARRYDGTLVSARQVGSTVRLVLDAGLPSLAFTSPSSTRTQQQSLEHNRRVVRDSAASDWLPHVTTYADGQESSATLVDCSGVAVPETFDGLGTLAVVGFDPARPDTMDTSAVATASQTAYMSPTHLYVATSPWSRMFRLSGPPVLPMNGSLPTRIYGFDLSGTAARYVGMGTVDGSIAGSWSMDDHDGSLRVAVATPSGSTSLVVLRPESGRLLDVGHLDGLGPGQELRSVRWFGDLAVLVTFRQIDPFYVVDVADPTQPRVLGALHLPGWSSYLHPVGPHLVLGLGQTGPGEVTIDPLQPNPAMPSVPGPSTPEPQSGVTASPDDGQVWSPPNVPRSWKRVIVPAQRAKASLFDISDLAHPRDVDTVSYPNGTVPMAGTDPHQVTWLPDRDTLLTVIGSGSVAATYGGSRVWVSVLTIRGGSLDDRLVPVAASDADGVRTVPLDDGRVVLVAGDAVSFLAL